MEPEKTTQQENRVPQPEVPPLQTIQPEYTPPVQPKELEKPATVPESPKEEKAFQESNLLAVNSSSIRETKPLTSSENSIA